MSLERDGSVCAFSLRTTILWDEMCTNPRSFSFLRQHAHRLFKSKKKEKKKDNTYLPRSLSRRLWRWAWRCWCRWSGCLPCRCRCFPPWTPTCPASALCYPAARRGSSSSLQARMWITLVGLKNSNLEYLTRGDTNSPHIYIAKFPNLIPPMYSAAWHLHCIKSLALHRSILMILHH